MKTITINGGTLIQEHTANITEGLFAMGTDAGGGLKKIIMGKLFSMIPGLGPKPDERSDMEKAHDEYSKKFLDLKKSELKKEAEHKMAMRVNAYKIAQQKKYNEKVAAAKVKEFKMQEEKKQSDAILKQMQNYEKRISKLKATPTTESEVEYLLQLSNDLYKNSTPKEQREMDDKLAVWANVAYNDDGGLRTPEEMQEFAKANWGEDWQNNPKCPLNSPEIKEAVDKAINWRPGEEGQQSKEDMEKELLSLVTKTPTSDQIKKQKESIEGVLNEIKGQSDKINGSTNKIKDLNEQKKALEKNKDAVEKSVEKIQELQKFGDAIAVSNENGTPKLEEGFSKKLADKLATCLDEETTDNKPTKKFNDAAKNQLKSLGFTDEEIKDLEQSVGGNRNNIEIQEELEKKIKEHAGIGDDGTTDEEKLKSFTQKAAQAKTNIETSIQKEINTISGYNVDVSTNDDGAVEVDVSKMEKQASELDEKINEEQQKIDTAQNEIRDKIQNGTLDDGTPITQVLQDNGITDPGKKPTANDLEKAYESLAEQEKKNSPESIKAEIMKKRAGIKDIYNDNTKNQRSGMQQLSPEERTKLENELNEQKPKPAITDDGSIKIQDGYKMDENTGKYVPKYVEVKKPNPKDYNGGEENEDYKNAAETYGKLHDSAMALADPGEEPEIPKLSDNPSMEEKANFIAAVKAHDEWEKTTQAKTKAQEALRQNDPANYSRYVDNDDDFWKEDIENADLDIADVEDEEAESDEKKDATEEETKDARDIQDKIDELEGKDDPESQRKLAELRKKLEDKPGENKQGENKQGENKEERTNPAKIWKRKKNRKTGKTTKRYYYCGSDNKRKKSNESISPKEYQDKMASFKNRTKNESLNISTRGYTKSKWAPTFISEKGSPEKINRVAETQTPKKVTGTKWKTSKL